MTVEGCVHMAKKKKAPGFCVRGHVCFLPEEDLESVLETAVPSDTCDPKTGNGVCTAYIIVGARTACVCDTLLWVREQRV